MNIRQQWREAWRTARIIHNSKPSNPDALASFDGLLWRAIMRRLGRDTPDPILASPATNREVRRIIDEILAEEQVTA